MFAATSRSDAPAPREALLPAYIRARGRIDCRFGLAQNGCTRLLDLGEGGGYRLKLPRGKVYQGVIVNTGGGMAGGDSLTVNIGLDAGARVQITTQSAEKIYRAQQDNARADTRLRLDCGASLSWLPQPGILFDGARLKRSLMAQIAPDATLLACEALLLGRTAMGETLRAGLIEDSWRIRRGGRLLFADDMRLSAPIDTMLAHAAMGGGARAFATILLVSPDAEARLESLRALLDSTARPGCDMAASAWNGMLVARSLARDAQAMIGQITLVLAHLDGTIPTRIWT